jgi:hypothetical protein
MKRNAMTLEESILEAVRSLPPEKQRELLDHAQRLQADSQTGNTFRTVKGLWADLDISLSREDLDEVRREIWKNFRHDEA